MEVRKERKDRNRITEQFKDCQLENEKYRIQEQKHDAMLKFHKEQYLDFKTKLDRINHRHQQDIASTKSALRDRESELKSLTIRFDTFLRQVQVQLKHFKVSNSDKHAKLNAKIVDSLKKIVKEHDVGNQLEEVNEQTRHEKLADAIGAFNHVVLPVETRSSIGSSHYSANQPSSIREKYNEKVNRLKQDYEHLRMKSDSLQMYS